MTTKVASVHFWPLHADRAMFQPQTHFFLKAVPYGGQPDIIEIKDQMQIEQGPHILSMDAKRRSQHNYPIASMAVAQDVVGCWSNKLGVTESQGPGVWVVRDRVPEVDDKGLQLVDFDKKGVFRPTTQKEFDAMFQEDLENARRRTMEYARWCVQEGNTLAAVPAKIPLIPPEYREAARYLKSSGFLTAELPWVMRTEQVIQNIKECPLCTEVIPRKAIVCPKCQQVIDAAGLLAFDERMKADAGKKLKAG
jgi:hypothetical protein